MDGDITIFGFNLSKALPKVLPEQLNAVKDKLIEDIGVSEYDELKDVEEKDLSEVLKPIQARKLIKLWKNDNLQVEVCSTVHASTSTTVNSQNIFSHSPNVNARWAETFEVNYIAVPKNIMMALSKGHRPHPSLRRAFIRHVADDIQKVCKSPLKRDLAIIARKIVSKYPCLGDTFCEQAIGIGYESILKKLLTRCENCNRKSFSPNSVTKTLDDIENVDDISPNANETRNKIGKKRRRVAATYAAINYQPQLLEGENEDCQLKKQEDMKLMYTEHQKSFDKEKAVALLNETFYMQRKCINLEKTMSFFITEWPLFLTKDGLLHHFHNLVGINIEERFQESFKKKTQRVFSVLAKTKAKDGIDDESEKHVYDLIIALLHHFKENKGFVFIEADSMVSRKKAEKIQGLPKTPCIIVCGNLKQAETFMLSVDCVVINETSNNFLDSFLMLMSSYFIFNIAYPEEACATLEFIQRCYLCINPDRGHKRQRNNGKSKVHPKILSLLEKLADYEWL